MNLTGSVAAALAAVFAGFSVWYPPASVLNGTDSESNSSARFAGEPEAEEELEPEEQEDAHESPGAEPGPTA